METIAQFLIPGALGILFLRLAAAPLRLGWKWLTNSACGFACLWLVNTVSGITGIFIPINAVTVLVAGVLGIPGMAVLAAL